MMPTNDWHSIIAAESHLSPETARQLRDIGFVVMPGPVIPGGCEQLSDAPIIGWLLYRKKVNPWKVSGLAMCIGLLSIAAGILFPVSLDPKTGNLQWKTFAVPAPGEPGKMPFWHGDRPARPVDAGRAIVRGSGGKRGDKDISNSLRHSSDPDHYR